MKFLTIVNHLYFMMKFKNPFNYLTWIECVHSKYCTVLKLKV